MPHALSVPVLTLQVPAQAAAVQQAMPNAPSTMAKPPAAKTREELELEELQVCASDFEVVYLRVKKWVYNNALHCVCARALFGNAASWAYSCAIDV